MRSICLPFKVFTKGRTLLAAACLIAFNLSAPTASAQFNGFGRAANQPFSGQVNVVNKAGLKQLPYLRPVRSVDIKPLLEEAITKVVGPMMEKTMSTELPKKKFDGFTPYLIKAEFAKTRANDKLYAGTDGTGFTIRYVSVGNSVTVGLHTPLPNDRDQNPTFKIPFDYELLIDVETGGLVPVVRNVRIKLNAGRPEGDNFFGRVAGVINNLVSAMGGPDFIGDAQNKINGKEQSVAGPIGVNLGKLGPALQNAGRNVIIRQMVDKGALILEMHKWTQPDVIK